MPMCFAAKAWISAPAHFSRTCRVIWARLGLPTLVVAMACWRSPVPWLILRRSTRWSTSRTWRCSRRWITGQEKQSLDVVLCNPPFHQQQVVGDFLAWRMFQQARDALVVGGALYIVGNRHLGYHSKLARLFRGVEQVAATPKFVILKARK